MGIVVCLALLVGVVAFLPSSWQQSSLLSLLSKSAPVVLLSLGLWNVFWYGLQHLNSVWGQVALVSGVVMLCAAGILGKQRLAAAKTAQKGVTSNQSSRGEQLVHLVIFVALIGFFLLYAITIIQLNLGLPILR